MDKIGGDTIVLYKFYLHCKTNAIAIITRNEFFLLVKNTTHFLIPVLIGVNHHAKDFLQEGEERKRGHLEGLQVRQGPKPEI